MKNRRMAGTNDIIDEKIHHLTLVLKHLDPVRNLQDLPELLLG